MLVEARAAAEAEAAKVRAEAIQVEGDAEAARIRGRNKANNTLSAQLIEFELTQARIPMLPVAFKSLMEPAKRIESIRVFDKSGFGAARASGEASVARSGPSDIVTCH